MGGSDQPRLTNGASDPGRQNLCDSNSVVGRIFLQASSRRSSLMLLWPQRRFLVRVISKAGQLAGAQRTEEQ